MKFFVDTADTDEIWDLQETGLLDGVTTNPSLVAKTGRDFSEVLAEICGIVDGPVSAEVTATDHAGMMAEGEKLARIADNIVVKTPLTRAGLKACHDLRAQGAAVNVTLCFTPMQALLAAKAGASFVSPFVGRLDDIASNGMAMVQDIVTLLGNYPHFDTQVLVASIRHPLHALEAARMGADVATLPPKVIHQLVQHPLTDSGLEAFLADWRKTGQSIV